MASTEKITNLEAFNKYVKTYKSNTEAARLFMTDESVQGMKAVKKQWAIVVNKLGQDKSREVLKKCSVYESFPVFQESVLYEAANTAAYLSSAEECRPTSCTSGEGSSECGTDCSCLLEGLSEVVKTLVLSPMDRLSPCQRRRT